MKKIIFATKNEGKIKEIKQILEPIEVCSIIDCDIDIVEDGATFRENAVKKAVCVCNKMKEITLADDSGLEIDFLNKEPGVYSARYMGENTPYPEKNAKILELLKDVPAEKRTARFVCVIAAAYPDGTVVTAEGVIEGIIAHEIKGKGGFGYDPIFYVPEYDMTTAEMPPELKNSISHRGKALRKIKEAILK